MLFDRFSGKMMSLCMRYARDQQQAQDILQIGFLKVFDYIHQYKGEGSFEGWMRRVFVTVAMRELGRKKIVFIDREISGDLLQAEDPSVFSKISEHEIHELIRSLPEGYRTVFNLHVIEGYSHEEIGELLHIQASTSRSQLLKARKLLQALIYKHYNTVIV